MGVSFSSTVTWAQDHAAEAIRQWKDAEAKQKAALDAHSTKISDYNSAVDRYNLLHPAEYTETLSNTAAGAVFLQQTDIHLPGVLPSW